MPKDMFLCKCQGKLTDGKYNHVPGDRSFRKHDTQCSLWHNCDLAFELIHACRCVADISVNQQINLAVLLFELIVGCK